jgi:CBS-domain-containing membrane protein
MIIRDWMKRNVVSIRATETIRQAAAVVVERHVGLLPVVDEQGKLMGVVGLRDLLSLELPDFFELIHDLDFIHDFGAVETTRPAPELLDQPVKSLMRPVTSVEETSGLLRSYALMLKQDLHDLPIVDVNGRLVGIASRVDLGTAILTTWKSVPQAKP